MQVLQMPGKRVISGEEDEETDNPIQILMRRVLAEIISEKKENAR